MVSECKKNYAKETLAVFTQTTTQFELCKTRQEKLIVMKTFYTTTLINEKYLNFLFYNTRFRNVLYNSLKKIKIQYLEDQNIQKEFPEFAQVLKDTEHYMKNVLICPEVWPIP